MKTPQLAGAFLCLLGFIAPLPAQNSGDRNLWLMNGSGSVSSTVDLGYIDPSWHIAATGCLHTGGTCDILWENVETGDRVIWLMTGSTITGTVYLTYATTDWRIVGIGGFHTGSTSDIVWENLGSGDRYVWLMTATSTGPTYSSGVDLGVTTTDWHIAGVGSFQSGGTGDLLWENTNSGQHSIWLMSGTTYVSAITVGLVAAPWRVVCAADFNGDGTGKTDILWENTSTGARSYYLMNAGAYVSSVTLTTTSTSWRMAGAADFNGDGKADILLEYVPTGDSDADGVNDAWEIANFGRTGVDPLASTTIAGTTDSVPYVIKQLLGMNPTANATLDGSIALKVTKPQ